MKIAKKQLQKIIREEIGWAPGRGQRELPRGRGYDALVSRLANEIGDLEMSGVEREEAMLQVLTREDLHNDAMIKGHISSELEDNVVAVPANESRTFKMNKKRIRAIIESVTKRL